MMLRKQALSFVNMQPANHTEGLPHAPRAMNTKHLIKADGPNTGIPAVP